MKTPQLLNYERDRWLAGDGTLAGIASAIDGAPVATTGSGGVDFGAMLRHAREVGGPALRKLTFHERARMIKALGLAIMARKEELYELNYLTGATRKDGWIDIEGGAGTLFSFSSKGRRELPDAHVLLDGQLEGLSKQGTFVGQHIYTPLQGAAVHINAFNFPVWGMLEKLAPTSARGRSGDREAGFGDGLSVRSRVPGHDRGEHPPAGRDPADRRRRRRSVRSFDRPGHRQLHRLGLDRAQASHPSDGHSRIGPLRRRAGQPQRLAARARRGAGNARVRPVRQGSRDRDDGQGRAEMHRNPPRHGAGRISRCGRGGARRTPGEDQGRRSARRGHAHGRAGQPQPARRRPREKIAELEAAGARIVAGDPDAEPPIKGGAFMPPVLLRTDDPWGTDAVHDCEPFGPVSTIMPYNDIADAIALANRGRAASCCRCSPIRPTPRASSSRARPPIMGGCW